MLAIGIKSELRELRKEKAQGPLRLIPCMRPSFPDTLGSTSKEQHHRLSKSIAKQYVSPCPET